MSLLLSSFLFVGSQTKTPIFLLADTSFIHLFIYFTCLGLHSGSALFSFPFPYTNPSQVKLLQKDSDFLIAQPSFPLPAVNFRIAPLLIMFEQAHLELSLLKACSTTECATATANCNHIFLSFHVLTPFRALIICVKYRFELNACL